jgi:hypothetical protein
MEKHIPIKVEYELPLENLSLFFDTLTNSEFETNHHFEDVGGLFIDSHGYLFSCQVTENKEADIVFKEDKQEEVFWIEDSNESNHPKNFIKSHGLDFSGHINFWTTLKSVQQSDISVLYRAMFLNGKLVKIELIDSSITTVQQKKRKHFFEKKLLLFLGKIVHDFSFFLLQTIHNRLEKISHSN